MNLLTAASGALPTTGAPFFMPDEITIEVKGVAEVAANLDALGDAFAYKALPPPCAMAAKFSSANSQP